MGLSSLEERKSSLSLSPKIYQPAEMDPGEGILRKRKMFSSSSFYSEPRGLYPTVEEQVHLCRKIAESLSDDQNLRSKGADMFFRRVQRADKWIVQEASGVEAPPAPSDPCLLPYVRPSAQGPRLHLLLAPRPLVDLDRLRREGVDIVEHNAVSPEVCQDIVRHLHSNDDKGGRLFHRRKLKSEEWVVDEEKVRQLMQSRYPGTWPEEPAHHPRVVELSGADVADSVMRAAESKIMRYPHAVPQVPVIRSLDDTCRAPRGWSGAPASPATEQTASGLRRAQSFHNFNCRPRAWNPDYRAQFRPVKPPSLLVQ